MEIICKKSKFLRNLFDQNTYIVKENGKALIIDAGAELDDIKEVLNGDKVIAILMTHLHFDHFWNLEQYISEFKCNVFVKEGFENKFEDFKQNCSYVIEEEIKCKIDNKNVKYYQKMMKIDNFNVQIYFIPGHCKDLVAIKIGDNLFSGDLIFEQGIGRTDLIDSDKNEMIDSLKLLKEIDFKMLYPGHYSPLTKSQVLSIIDNYN